MDIQELANNQEVIKWMIGIISFSFFSIITLLIYIWKTNIDSMNRLLDDTAKTLGEVVTLTAVHESKLESIEKKIDK